VPSTLLPGTAKRDAALDLHDQNRRELLTAARRLLLQHLLANPVATLDDVGRQLHAPEGVDLRCLGAAGRRLAELGIIIAAGYVRSTRPNRNASPVQQWRLADRRLAEKWLAENRPRVATRQQLLPGLA